MHREIKFRAWDVEMQNMVSWDELERDWEQEGYYSSVFDVRERHHWVPMQYTGFKDKNGNDIYEHDIIDQRFKLIVEWKNGRWACKTRTETFAGLYEVINLREGAGTPVEILGNFYENPELIEQITDI